MKKEIIDVNKDLGIFRATTSDERWYIKPTKDLENGLPVYKFYPSATWIVHYYYTSPFLTKWRDEKGADVADAIKIAAGEKGSKIHQACEMLDKGEEIKIGDPLMNWNKGMEEAITVEEWEAIISYRDWFDVLQPQILCTEMTVFNEQYGYAGTLDKIIAVPNPLFPQLRQIWILDIKTSKVISKGHIMQISAYAHADIDYKKLGITDAEWKDRKICTLQLGYQGNKNRYKFTEQDDKFPLFLNIMESWKEENPNTKPRQIDLPISVKLVTKVAENIKTKAKVNGKVSKSDSVSKDTQDAKTTSKEA